MKGNYKSLRKLSKYGRGVGYVWSGNRGTGAKPDRKKFRKEIPYC